MGEREAGAVTRIGQQIGDDAVGARVAREVWPGGAGHQAIDLEGQIGERGRGAELQWRAGDIGGSGIADDRRIGVA